MADVRMVSPKGTTVIAEAEGFRERASDERVHLHEDGETRCQRCFASGSLVWTDSVERWALHAARCEAMA